MLPIIMDRGGSGCFGTSSLSRGRIAEGLRAELVQAFQCSSFCVELHGPRKVGEPYRSIFNSPHRLFIRANRSFDG